jgi:hypothetical protein
MKVYLFFIQPKDVGQELRENLERDYSEIIRGDIYYLFGYTTEAKIAFDFLQIYNKRHFSMAEIKLDKQEYRKFNSSNKKFMLKYHNLYGKSRKHGILSTKSQITIIEEYYTTELFGELGELAVMEYDILKTEYIMALDALFYTFYHLMNGDDVDVSMADNSLSYGLSAEGYWNKVSVRSNEVSLFINLYKSILLVDGKE